MNVSACGYYKWISKEKSNKKSTREELIKDIQKIYQASQCRYGAPKIHAELKVLGKNYNIKTVQNVMQEMAFKPNLDEGLRLRNFKQTIEL
ncbi:IS3 family transposase [Wolbachia endosymbiont (group B) of Idaea biselata]|uniref:IS3 family transposase n=1 Tax=Wolbachia endosymbiont (group B) of Idaea biselata TaxID=3066179 RepID=UPI003132CA1E